MMSKTVGDKPGNTSNELYDVPSRPSGTFYAVNRGYFSAEEVATLGGEDENEKDKQGDTIDELYSVPRQTGSSGAFGLEEVATLGGEDEDRGDEWSLLDVQKNRLSVKIQQLEEVVFDKYNRLPDNLEFEKISEIIDKIEQITEYLEYDSLDNILDKLSIVNTTFEEWVSLREILLKLTEAVDNIILLTTKKILPEEQVNYEKFANVIIENNLRMVDQVLDLFCTLNSEISNALVEYGNTGTITDFIVKQDIKTESEYNEVFRKKARLVLSYTRMVEENFDNMLHLRNKDKQTEIKLDRLLERFTDLDDIIKSIEALLDLEKEITQNNTNVVFRLVQILTQTILPELQSLCDKVAQDTKYEFSFSTVVQRQKLQDVFSKVKTMQTILSNINQYVNSTITKFEPKTDLELKQLKQQVDLLCVEVQESFDKDIKPIQTRAQKLLCQEKHQYLLSTNTSYQDLQKQKQECELRLEIVLSTDEGSIFKRFRAKKEKQERVQELMRSSPVKNVVLNPKESYKMGKRTKEIKKLENEEACMLTRGKVLEIEEQIKQIESQMNNLIIKEGEKGLDTTIKEEVLKGEMGEEYTSLLTCIEKRETDYKRLVLQLKDKSTELDQGNILVMLGELTKNITRQKKQISDITKNTTQTSYVKQEKITVGSRSANFSQKPLTSILQRTTGQPVKGAGPSSKGI